MLWTLLGILILLWVLGTLSTYTPDGIIHLLLVVAIGVVLVKIIQEQTPVK